MRLSDLVKYLEEHERLINQSNKDLETLIFLHYDKVEITYIIENGQFKIKTTIDDLLNR